MTTDVEKMDEARDAFEKWTSKYDHYSNEYLNMGADVFFVAGYQAALESASIAALIAEVRALREAVAGSVAETLRMAEAQSKLQRSVVIQECVDAVADLSGDEYSPGWNNAISDAVDRLNAMRGAPQQACCPQTYETCHRGQNCEFIAWRKESKSAVRDCSKCGEKDMPAGKYCKGIGCPLNPSRGAK